MHLQNIGISFDAVYTGKMARQRQTFQAMAEVFAGSNTPLPAPTAVADLNEYDAAGIWKRFYPEVVRDNQDPTTEEERWLKNPKQFQKMFAHLVRKWATSPEPQSDLESWQAFRARIGNVLERIMRKEGSGKNLLVCSSAGPIAAAVQMATAMPDDRCIGLSWQVWNASLTKFRYNSEKMTLVGFNDVAALEIRGDAALLTYR